MRYIALEHPNIETILRQIDYNLSKHPNFINIEKEDELAKIKLFVELFFSPEEQNKQNISASFRSKHSTTLEINPFNINIAYNKIINQGMIDLTPKENKIDREYRTEIESLTKKITQLGIPSGAFISTGLIMEQAGIIALLGLIGTYYTGEAVVERNEKINEYKKYLKESPPRASLKHGLETIDYLHDAFGLPQPKEFEEIQELEYFPGRRIRRIS